MGNRIAGVLSVPVLFAALFAGENNIDSQKPVVPKIAPLTPITRNISMELTKQPQGQASAAPQAVGILQNWFNGEGIRPFFNFQFRPVIPAKVYIEPEISQNFRKCSDFQKREQYLTDVLELINPNLLQKSNIFGDKTALSEFNRKNDVNFRCLGIRGKPCEFVLIDENYFLKSGIGKTNVPRRISVSLEEAQKVQSKESVINLLESRLQEHDELYESENVMWNSSFKFDFPKNKGACMITLELNPDRGMETDVAYFLDVYVKEFGMSPYSLSIGTKHLEDMNSVLEEKGYGELSNIIVPATKDSILTNLRQSLRKAVDEKKEFFVFHHLAHGSAEGKICAEDGKFDPREISEVISDMYEGEPLCSKLDIYIQAGSCYSGKQLEGMIDFFKWGRNKDIPVKNLYIVSESNHTPAVFSSSWEGVSLISDNPVVRDDTGPQAYYDSWVKEYSNYLKTKGLEIRPEINSMLWRLRFADLMSWYDEKQDMKGYHYSNDPKKGKVQGQYFTDLRPVIGESQTGSSYAMLQQKLKDERELVPGKKWNEFLNDLRSQVA